MNTFKRLKLFLLFLLVLNLTVCAAPMPPPKPPHIPAELPIPKIALQDISPTTATKIELFTQNSDGTLSPATVTVDASAPVVSPVNVTKVWLFGQNADGTLSPATISGGGGGCSPSASAGQILYSPAGTDCGGVPGSIADTNGAVTLAPTGTGVALTLTGDANGSDILDVNANGTTGGGALKIDTNGNLMMIESGEGTMTLTPNSLSIVNADDDNSQTSISDEGFSAGPVSGTGPAAQLLRGALYLSGDGVNTIAVAAVGTELTVDHAIKAPALTTGGASNTDLAGSVTNSGGTGSYSFAATLTNVPICWARSNTSIADELSVTVTTSSITVTTTGATSTWVYGCTLRN